MLRRYIPRAVWLSAGLVFIGVAPAREPLNLSTAKEAVLHYVDTGYYERDVAIVAGQACQWVEERVGRKTPGEKLMLVLDVDETALSNLRHMREMDFGYQPIQWNSWVEEGTAPAIKPVLEVFQTARRLGVTVVFITGREEKDRPGTERNLLAAGFTNYHELVCKPSPYPGKTEQFKTGVRQRLATEGWTIIANLGDQPSDLGGGASEKTFKLPNPFYLIP